MFYCRRASLLCKISTIHDKSFKAMAETYHIYKLMKLKWLFITTCADYILSFHTLVRTIVITQWLYLLSTAGESECVSVQILPLREKGLFGGPVGSLQVQPPIWPGQIPLLYPGDDISKNHLSRPFSSRVISWHRTFLSCVLLYVRCKSKIPKFSSSNLPYIFQAP